MKLRFVLIEFDEFIFNNFKDEIQVYTKKEYSALIDVSLSSGRYKGRYVSDGVYRIRSFSREELYMSIPIYLSETFTNLKPYV